MDMHEPVFDNTFSPFVVTHDVACAVCGADKAVYEVQVGIFQPCWKCQGLGFKLIHKRRRLGWLNFINQKRT